MWVAEGGRGIAVRLKENGRQKAAPPERHSGTKRKVTDNGYEQIYQCYTAVNCKSCPMRGAFKTRACFRKYQAE